MFDINELTFFFGWMTMINVGLLVVASALMVLFKEGIMKLHSQLLGINEEKLSTLYFQYLSNYKIATIIFNLTPYLALKMIN